MVEWTLDERTVKRIRQANESVSIDISSAKLRNYPLQKIIVQPAWKFIDEFPKNAVPVYILGKNGRRILPAVVKNSRAFTSTTVMARAMPTVIAANPTRDSHGIVHYSEGQIIQIGSFHPPKTKEQALERYLKKAEDVTAFGWMLADPKRENVSAMEHFDPITMDIPAGVSKRRALQIQLTDGLHIAGMRDAPMWAIRRIIDYDERKVLDRLLSEKRHIWTILRRGYTR